jgi:hypothetical protein
MIKYFQPYKIHYGNDTNYYVPIEESTPKHAKAIKTYGAIVGVIPQWYPDGWTDETTWEQFFKENNPEVGQYIIKDVFMRSW